MKTPESLVRSVEARVMYVVVSKRVDGASRSSDAEGREEELVNQGKTKYRYGSVGEVVANIVLSIVGTEHIEWVER